MSLATERPLGVISNRKQRGMLASDFIPPPRRTFSLWQRYLSYVPLYALGVPLAQCLEAMGKWPDVLAQRMRATWGDFGEYEPTCHDVFVCSYFKSGATWTLQMAIQIAHRGAAEFAFLHDAVAWPDAPGVMRRRVIPLDEPSPVQRSPTGLRVIKTHLPSAEVPYSPEARYIALVRDPKDVCVSGYHFLRSLIGPLAPNVTRYVDFFLSPRFAAGSWSEHLNGYWRIRERANVLFLTYEELRRDGSAAVSRIAEFMEVDLSGDEFEEAVRRSSFEYMKNAGDQFNPGQMFPWGAANGYLVRRGKAGGSAELLTAGLRERIDSHFRAELHRLGCGFPYDIAFDSEA
jgi:hypothetical protein